MHTSQDQTSKLPLVLKLVAGYLLVIGVLSLLLPLLSSGPRYADFDAKPAAYKFGAQARSITLNVLYVASGVGLFRRRSWARKLGLLVLVASTIYGAYAFAWGFAHGRPSPVVLVMSFAIAGVWNAIWFCLLYRRSSAQALS
jgi:predicted cobalt transporter CbtA